jgi:ABC-type nitrate/sulfonate/bicarbonate transport system permease component
VSSGDVLQAVAPSGVAVPVGVPVDGVGPPTGRSGGARARSVVSHPAGATLVGLALLLALWWFLAAVVLRGTLTLAAPPAVVREAWDFRSLLWRESGTTLQEAALGFVGGNLIGCGLAIAFVQSRRAEKAVLQLAIVTHCLPIVALGPLLELLLTGTEPRIVMSALLVFFPAVVTVQVGLKRTDRTALELVTVFGGTSIHQLRYVRLMGAVPYMLTAFKITAPLALLGAILGEFMGGSGGLGVLIITSQDQSNVARTWAIAATCTLWSVAAFGLFSLLSLLLVPWSPRSGVRS